MIVHIRGTGVHNRGAELMAIAIQDRLSIPGKSIRFAVRTGFGPYAARASHGFWTVVHPTRISQLFAVRWLLTRRFGETYGLVRDIDVNAVLDASGFAFGDQWGERNVRKLANEARLWRKRGIKVVLLPQAFGPFTNRTLRSEFRRALDHLDLVYARDEKSYNYIQELGGAFPNLRRAPDFTILVQGTVPNDLEIPGRLACIVPNMRMLDSTPTATSERYVDFLANCVHELERHDAIPWIVLHDQYHDRHVAELLQKKLDRSLPVFDDRDPKRLKGLLGRAFIVVGSRFHALVGSLSQGVPTIGTSWSHKYSELFDDYGCSGYLLSPSEEPSKLRDVVAEICDDAAQTKLRARLAKRAAAIRQEVEHMFDEVEKTIGIQA